jgi:hypothetical protein
MPLAERVHKVRLLLVTLNDGYPTTQGSLDVPSGVAEGRRVPCDDCKRRGWLRTRQGDVLCLVCDGQGWRRRQHEEEPWDEYVGLPTAEAAQLPTMPSAPAVDAILARLADERDEREGRLAGLAYGWERARAAADRRGSYKELRRSLDRMRGDRPQWHRLVVAKLVNDEPRSYTPKAETAVELGVVWVALDMRGPVRVPPWVMERERADRARDTVELLARDGLTPAQIAQRLGMTKKAVKRRLRSRIPSDAGVAPRAI